MITLALVVLQLFTDDCWPLAAAELSNSLTHHLFASTVHPTAASCTAEHSTFNSIFKWLRQQIFSHVSSNMAFLAFEAQNRKTFVEFSAVFTSDIHIRRFYCIFISLAWPLVAPISQDAKSKDLKLLKNLINFAPYITQNRGDIRKLLGICRRNGFSNCTKSQPYID